MLLFCPISGLLADKEGNIPFISNFFRCVQHRFNNVWKTFLVDFRSHFVKAGKWNMQVNRRGKSRLIAFKIVSIQ